MDQPVYPLEASDDRLRFEFVSIGNRHIRKANEYSPLPTNSGIFNLAFGDLTDDGLLQDDVTSDNADLELVIATVIRTVVEVLDRYPAKTIFFTGSNAVRTRLYRIIITKYLSQIEPQFSVLGLSNGTISRFVPGQKCYAFLIRLTSIP